MPSWKVFDRRPELTVARMRTRMGIGNENISTRSPTMPSARPARFCTLPTWPPRGGLDVVAVARQIPLARNV